MQSIALRHFRARGWPAVLSYIIDSTEMKELVLTPGDSLKDGSECYTSHMILMVSYALLLPSVCVVEVWRVGERKCRVWVNMERKWTQLHITFISSEHFIVE